MQYLTDHAYAWLKDDEGLPLGVAARLIMPSGTRRSDGAFYKALGKSLRLTASDTASCSCCKDRLLNYIRYRCGQAHVRLMVLFIDNAQRMTRQEMEYLIDVDDIIHDEKLRLFLLFMHQSDEAGVEVDASAIDYPSHITRRWTMGGSHRYSCLHGLPDVEHALSRYRTSAFWPDEDTSFCRYFAKGAVDAGWLIEQDAPLILYVSKPESGFRPAWAGPAPVPVHLWVRHPAPLDASQLHRAPRSPCGVRHPCNANP